MKNTTVRDTWQKQIHQVQHFTRVHTRITCAALCRKMKDQVQASYGGGSYVETTPAAHDVSNAAQCTSEFRILHGSYSIKGLHHPNEDRVKVATVAGGSELALVIDGHDGSRCADFVQSYFPPLISEATPAALSQAFADTEAAWFEFVRKQLVRPHGSVVGLTSGACVTSVLLSPRGDVIAANIGDARAIVRRRDGRIETLTEDHRCCNPAEVERIQRAGGWIKNNRVVGVLEPTRTIGDLEEKAAAPGACVADPALKTSAIAPAELSSYDEVVAAWDKASSSEAVQSKPASSSGGALKPFTMRYGQPTLSNSGKASASKGAGTALTSLGAPGTVLRLKAPAAATATASDGGAPSTPVLLLPPLPVSITEAAALASCLPVSFLLVATDGVWDVLSSQSATAVVTYALARYRDPRLAAAELCRVAQRCGSADDISAIVLWLLRQ